MRTSQVVVSLTALLSSADALAFNGARETVDATSKPCAAAQHENGLREPPRPTKAPVLTPELLKRQQVDLIAPDNTCGYISGLAGAAYYCYSQIDSCAFFPATAPNAWGFVGCCNAKACGARVTCVDAVQYSSQSICDNGCEKDTFTLKCTASSRPYCNKIRWPKESVQDYFCDDTSVSTWQTASTTYLNQVGRTFSPLTITPTTSSTQSGTSSSSSTTSSSQTTNPITAVKHHKPIGAIIGGIIGGIILLTALVAGLIILIRSRANKKSKPYPPAYPQNPNGASGTEAYALSGTTTNKLSYPDTTYTGVYGPSSQGYAPLPDQQHQQPQAYGYTPQGAYDPQFANQAYAHPQPQNSSMAEAPANTTYPPPASIAPNAATLGATTAYDPHHSTISQPSTAVPYSPSAQSHHSMGTLGSPVQPQPSSSQQQQDQQQSYQHWGQQGLHEAPGEQHAIHEFPGQQPPPLQQPQQLPQQQVQAHRQVQGQRYEPYSTYIPPRAGEGGVQPQEMMVGAGAGPWSMELHEVEGDAGRRGGDR